MDQCNTSVFNDPKFKYNLPDEWKKKAQEEVNENPETVLEELSEFRKKVKAVPGLRSRLDDCFLLSFLRAFFFDQEEALKGLLRFYEFRGKYPEYFEPLPLSVNKEFNDRDLYKILPEKDSLGRTVAIIRIGTYDFSKHTVDHMWRVIFTALDCFLLDQTFQVGGIVVIIDCSFLSLMHLRQVTFKFIKVTCHVMLNTYPVHFRAFHVLNPPIYYYAGHGMVKPFLSKRLLEKEFIHGSEMKDFDNHILNDSLPQAYGGTVPGFKNDWFLRQLEDMEEALKENNTRYGFHRNEA